MGIFSRLSDIVNSNINAILDKAEDPEKIIRLMIQEMEDTLVEVRSSAARVIAERKGLSRRLESFAGLEKDWGQKAELALRKGREDLARAALVEKAKVADTASALAGELAHLDSDLEAHEEDIVKLEGKLGETRAKQKALLGRHRVATSRVRIRRQLDDSRLDEAFSRFDYMERRIERAEADVESFDLGQGKGKEMSLSAEIAGLEAEDGIGAELEALKAKLGGDQKAPAKKG